MCDLVADVNTCCTLDDFNDTFSLQCESIPNSISLCKKHRTQVSNFRMTKNTSRCFICKSVIRSEDRIYCSTVLSETAVIRLKEIDTAFSVSNDVHLCAGCYRYSMRSISKIPTLDELEDEIIKQNQSIGEIQTPKDACNKALVSTLQILLMICRKEHGFLMPRAYELYLQTLKKVCADTVQYEFAKRSKTWLKVKIMDQIGDKLLVSKASFKKGDFLYVKDLTKGEIIQAWHSSQAEIRVLKSKCQDIPEEEESINSLTNENLTNAKWYEVLSTVNQLLRNQGKEISDKFSKDPFSVLSFDLGDVKSLFNPQVWNMICALTGSREELSKIFESIASFGEEFTCFPSNASEKGFMRRNKRIALVFMLQFILNDDNTYPFHVITASCIKQLSNSSKLLKLINKLGFSSSESTLERFFQGLLDKRQAAGPLWGLSPSLTFVSIDNIDVMSSYAAVTADKPRSWHGTSIMAQQPKPKSL